MREGTCCAIARLTLCRRGGQKVPLVGTPDEGRVLMLGWCLDGVQYRRYEANTRVERRCGRSATHVWA